MRILQSLLKWCFIVFLLISTLIGLLYIYKYISTKDINDELDNVNIKIFKHKNLIFKYGNKGGYPFLQVSTDNRCWKRINVRGFLFDSIPLESRFDYIESKDNTIWFYHLKSCIECDCSNYIYNIYYSHDNGDTWNTISPKGTCTSISFKNDRDGVMKYGERNFLYTYDGGKTWLEKK